MSQGLLLKLAGGNFSGPVVTELDKDGFVRSGAQRLFLFRDANPATGAKDEITGATVAPVASATGASHLAYAMAGGGLALRGALWLLLSDGLDIREPWTVLMHGRLRIYENPIPSPYSRMVFQTAAPAASGFYSAAYSGPAPAGINAAAPMVLGVVQNGTVIAQTLTDADVAFGASITYAVRHDGAGTVSQVSVRNGVVEAEQRILTTPVAMATPASGVLIPSMPILLGANSTDSDDGEIQAEMAGVYTAELGNGLLIATDAAATALRNGRGR